MKTSPINQTNIVNNKKAISFQHGLTKEFLHKAETLSYSELERLLYKKGIKKIHTGGYKSIATSCLATSEIFQHFGLALPKKFFFEETTQDNIIGFCEYPECKVGINSSFPQFTDLIRQDDFETYRKESAITKHFLHTYIHEFMHSAHDANLLSKYSIEDGAKIIKTLMSQKPSPKIIQPKVFMPSWEKWEEKWNNGIIGSYGATNLIEFFVENATFEISRLLEKKENLLACNEGKNIFFNPKKSKNLSLSFLKEDEPQFFWRRFIKNIKNLSKSPKEDDRTNLLKAIWNGDIEALENSRLSKYIIK